MKQTLSKVLLGIALSALSLPAISKSLTFSYWTQAGAPFVMIEKDSLVGGLIKNLGDEISKRLGYKPNYEEFPVGRVEQALIVGEVDMTCITSPIWRKKADQYKWSPRLFLGQDRFVVRTREDIKTFADLEGKTIGVYHDFTYHPEIMSMFESGKSDKLVVRDVSTGLRLVSLKRIDAFIEFGSILSYELKKTNDEGLMLASRPADEFSLHCAYSPKMPVDSDKVDAVIGQMVEEGIITDILNRYR